MNSKIIISAILVIIVLGFGYYLYGNQNKTKNAPFYNTQNSNSKNTINAPVDPNGKGITSVLLVYGFYGRVSSIEVLGENHRITLDNPDKNLPEFIVTKDTVILKATNDSRTQASFSDVKNGSGVELNASHDLQSKTWKLNLITIFYDAPTPSPTSSPK